VTTSAARALADLAAELDAPDVEPGDSAAVSYAEIPYIPRRWLWDGYATFGNVAVFAAAGGTGKGMLWSAAAARTVLGLPFPNEDQDVRRDPMRVVWITGVGEDDIFEDLAPRLRAAISAAVAEFGLDPALAHPVTGAIRLVTDLSKWKDDSPVTLPADCGRVLAELRRLNADGERRGLPPVGLVVCDSLSALLSEGFTIDSRQGARRVMLRLSLMARRSGTAVVVLHHLTKDGKVAGSPAVLDSVRLAFLIGKDRDDETRRVITQHKANSSNAPELAYRITGSTPDTHAVFTADGGERAERIAAAGLGSARDDDRAARIAAAGACRHPGRLGTPRQCGDCPAAGSAPAADPGPFRVICRRQAPGAEPDRPRLVGTVHSTREAARIAAVADAGRPLSWQPAPGLPGMDAAAFLQAGGLKVSYGIVPPARPRAEV
jgi:AAA domain